LVDHGYEVGNHTADHVELTDVSDAFFTNSIAAMIEWINERVPEGPGNLSHALVMPFGAYPDPDLHPEQRAWLAEGFWYEGEPVNLDVVFAVSGGPAIPLYSLEADPSYTYRIASYPEILEPWQDSVLSRDAHLFISDGDPDTVTIPADQLANLDEVWAAEHGLEVRT
jgi:peptidoglycan/xylan/chitin deacetylase (PgdA/CDA1 family)